MFGIGFTELLLISIVAILFLGPDKLPEAMIEVAKFIKGIKKTVSEAKSSLEEEMKIADLKEEALNYKKQLDAATSELKNFKNIDFEDFKDEGSAEFPKTASKETNPDSTKTAQNEALATQVEAKNDTVTFKKPKKQKKKEATDERTDKPESDA